MYGNCSDGSTPSEVVSRLISNSALLSALERSVTDLGSANWERAVDASCRRAPSSLGVIRKEDRDRLLPDENTNIELASAAKMIRMAERCFAMIIYCREG